MRWLAALAVVAAVVAPAAAAGRKVLVLPVDGAVDAATRSRLTADVARLARALDGQVATGSATFTDTALAVGCDPRAPSCADEVMATLGVDELVWSTATREGHQTRLVVRRAARGAARREASTTFPAGDAGDRIASGIAPLFAPPEARPSEPPRAGAPADGHGAGAPDLAAEAGSPAGAPVEAAPPPPALPAPDDHRGRTAGIAIAAGGAASVVLGLALWASYASLQGQIDGHPLRTRADFDDLVALEDRANSRAIAGDVFVIAGLVAGGIGAYLWYRGHRPAIAIAPAPIAHGGGVTITLIGAP